MKEWSCRAVGFGGSSPGWAPVTGQNTTINNLERNSMKKMMKCVVALGIAAVFPMALIAGDCKTECAEACAKACPASSAEAYPCPVSSAAKATCVDSKCDKLTKVEYTLTGLTCPDQAARVTKAVAGLDGVVEPKVCAKSGKAVMAIDAKRVKDAQLVAAIEQTGLKVQKEVLTVKVTGLKCGDCSAKVSQAVAAVKGAKAEAVCHQSGQAVVSFDPKKVSRDQVLAAINRTGFSVAP